MDDQNSVLLDSPKRRSLQTQSQDLRAALKTFERTFVEHHGRKVKQNDIKNDPAIAAKYKQYHRVQDVIAGKLAYEKLQEENPSKKSKSRTHSRQDSGIGSSPRKHSQSVHATPRKNLRAYELDPYDVPGSTSPRLLMRTIGPTPHRDGKVLGLFDLLPSSASGKGFVATPSSSARKRKIDELYQDTPARRSPLKVIQTPSQRKSKNEGDLLQFLGNTPQKSSGEGAAKFSRTPQSEGKKFQLSQFFATPSTQRFLFADDERGTVKKTPLRDAMLGRTPQKPIDTTGLDATPAYLRRSTSFKDRLLSASKPATTSDSTRTSPPPRHIGPPTLKHFRSSTSNILKLTDIQQDRSSRQEQARKRPQPQAEDEFDDDMEALRELEGGNESAHVLVEDSQLNLEPSSDGELEAVQSLKPYKKKGQKRTTRKANIRPVSRVKASREHRFIAADEPENEGSNVEEGVEETRFMTDDDDDGVSDFEDDESNEKESRTKRKTAADPKKTSNPISSKTGKPKKQAGMINPNAQSHQNFRSHKIKNSGSKGKPGGNRRFGKGRR